MNDTFQQLDWLPLLRVGFAVCGFGVFYLGAGNGIAQPYQPRDVTQAFESLPATDTDQFARSSPADCPPVPPDPPLLALTADIRPRNSQGGVASGDSLPPDCARSKFGDDGAIILPLESSSCEPTLCEMLELAQFCHRPLYFNDEPLERFGVRWCRCQPVGSAALFVGDTICLPLKMVIQRPCSCEPTPPCSPCY